MPFRDAVSCASLICASALVSSCDRTAEEDFSRFARLGDVCYRVPSANNPPEGGTFGKNVEFLIANADIARLIPGYEVPMTMFEEPETYLGTVVAATRGDLEQVDVDGQPVDDRWFASKTVASGTVEAIAMTDLYRAKLGGNSRLWVILTKNTGGESREAQSSAYMAIAVCSPVDWGGGLDNRCWTQVQQDDFHIAFRTTEANLPLRASMGAQISAALAQWKVACAQ